MFERYTEKARQVIFVARLEASQFGSPCIETEHLLLGQVQLGRSKMHLTALLHLTQFCQQIVLSLIKDLSLSRLNVKCRQNLEIRYYGANVLPIRSTKNPKT